MSSSGDITRGVVPSRQAALSLSTTGLALLIYTLALAGILLVAAGRPI